MSIVIFSTTFESRLMSPLNVTLPLAVFPCKYRLKRFRGCSSVDATTLDEIIGRVSAWVLSNSSRVVWVRWSAATPARCFTASVWCRFFSSQLAICSTASGCWGLFSRRRNLDSDTANQSQLTSAIGVCLAGRRFFL